MRPCRRSRARPEEGASAVEFALIAFPLLVLLIGIIQFSIWFWAYQTASHAAREGARYAAVHPCDTAAIQSKAMTRVNESAPVQNNSATISVTRTASPIKVGSEVTVRVQFNALTFGLIPGFSGAIDKRATTRVENIPAGTSC